ncbi:hypothetical protein [Pseudomonas sp. FP1742]|uniref:hypothetical protein n=1 Tax=Pseudomonas sp. FP1742 TaxID=2954079 RepID=UPI002733ACCD|nr:hypothetical protein [Pseudomonas sp. FP1742]WLG48084.1 hypothetical protein PSH64_15045 [Pseudomonas sp. FP1742]
MSDLFWPRRQQHFIRMVELSRPNSLNKDVLNLLGRILSMVNALRSLQSLGDAGKPLRESIKKTIANHLSSASGFVQDDDSSRMLAYAAEGLTSPDSNRAMGPLLAGLNEKEVVGYVGGLTTWLGKTRSLFYSAFFGTPNARLQRVSDIIDGHFQESLLRINGLLGSSLRTVPGCSYKIIDLFGIAGEANSFPKHFAYFLPEDNGVKHSPVKRTVVFANTYKSLYEHISLEQISLFGWTAEQLPALEEVDGYLIAWFRGHDLGHSIVLKDTDYAALSRCDRWGSMVVQEAVADVFGFLVSQDPEVVARLGLDPAKAARVYMLELLRYLRRGPALFPDAGAAYIQLRLLEECAVVVKEGDRLRVDINRFHVGMVYIAQVLLNNVLNADADTFKQFISRYSPHLLENAGEDLLYGQDICDMALGYHQALIEGSDSGVQ